MPDPTRIETWICLLREGPLGEWAPNVVIYEDQLHEMVAAFRPLPVEKTTGVLLSDATPEALTGLDLVRVEVRHDEHGGAYLAGLVRSPELSPTFYPARRDRQTGKTHASLVGVAFVRTPSLPGPALARAIFKD
jgi:hypothetical protein